MRAGSLRYPITIEHYEIVKNAYGEEMETQWNKHTKTRAEVLYQNGNRINDNNDIFFATNVVFNMRNYLPIKELDRIIYDGKRYRILAIENRKEYKMLSVKCELINE